MEINLNKFSCCILFVFVLYACNTTSSPVSLFAKWKISEITVTSGATKKPGHIAFSQYGVSRICLNSDSSFQFTSSISKDITIRGDFMGIDGERTIVKAGFSNYETGKFTITGDTISAYDTEGKLLLVGKHDLKGNIFVFSYIDKDKNSWFISLERD